MSYAIIMAVETAGFRPYTQQIVEAAAVVLGPSLNEIEHFRVVANPGADVIGRGSAALARRGLRIEELRAAAPPAEAGRIYREFLGRHATGPVHVSRCGLQALSLPPWDLPKDRAGEDVIEAAIEVMEDSEGLDLEPDGKPRRPTLEEIAKFFGLTFVRDGGSLSTARAAAAIYAATLAQRNSADHIALTEARWIMEDGL